MSRDEAIDHLGTIAKSGHARVLLEAVVRAAAGHDGRRPLIGQFGVGFYSAFIVADRVTVETRRAGLPPNDGVRWESDGAGEFSVEAIDRPKRGTSITLHLRADDDDFLSAYRLKAVLKKYSDHISLPIRMRKEEWDKDKNEYVTTDDVETINQASALWTRPKSEITDEQYQEFYKHVSHDFAEPLAWTHSRVEGRSEYTQLLFIPKEPPFDLWDRERRAGIKLYVKRVFIMDDAEQLMPVYLRFVKGVIDSNDLPLNVSREILQESRDVKAIREGSTKKVLGMIEDLATNQPDDFATVLEVVRPGAQGRPRRGSREQGPHREAGALREHARRQRRADRVARGLRRPHEGRPGQDLLRDRRVVHGREEQPASGGVPQEGRGGADPVGPRRRMGAQLPDRVRRQGARQRREGRSRPRLARGRGGEAGAGEGVGRVRRRADAHEGCRWATRSRTSASRCA